MRSNNINIHQDPHKLFIVNYAPVFANLKPAEKDLIIQKSKIVEFKKGDTVYKKLDPPDAFYCVITGRIRIFNIIGGRKEALEYLNCGKYFGIISLLTGELHSVNAEAANDSKILKIDKEDFQLILEKVPQLAVDLSKTLSRRLRKKDTYEKKIFESNIISVFSAVSRTGRTMYAINLAISLRKETAKEVILVNIRKSAGDKGIRLDSPFFVDTTIKEAVFKDLDSGISILDIRHEDTSGIYAANLNALLTQLTGNYHYIVVDLPLLIDEAVFQTLSQSDTIHIVTDGDEENLAKTNTLTSELFGKVKYPQEKIRIILKLKKEETILSYEEALRFLNTKIYATIPWLETEKPVDKAILEEPDSEYAKAIRRIAREVGNVRVGLALSGGAALGLAHIGVIKVLERENIPIDMIAGSSMGALIGALWAIGLNSHQIEKIALEYNNNKKRVFHLMVDPCFPKLSFMKGRGIRRFLEKHIGNKTFRDLKLPLRIIALNVSKRQELVFDSGNLIDAIMASIAIPGVFYPVRVNGDLVIDGGIIEPVPIGTLVKMGIKKIIGVNVLPSPENIIQTHELNKQRINEERKHAQSQGFFARITLGIRLYLRKIFFPNILDVIINSIQTMEYVIAQMNCQMADVVLQPKITGVDWFELFKAEALIRKGEEEAENMLAAMRSIVTT